VAKTNEKLDAVEDGSGPDIAPVFHSPPWAIPVMGGMHDAVVMTLPITSAVKLNLQMILGISYSDVMPSITQATVQVQLALDVPETGWKPGDALRDDQERLAQVVAYVAQALDHANVMRLATMIEELRSTLQGIESGPKLGQDEL